MAERSETFDIRKARTVHKVDARRWLGSGYAYWLEWDHPGETPRPFAGIIEGLEGVRWRQLIKPGSAAIDVGTHSGDTTIPMGLFAYDKDRNTKGRIIGIEPNPELHPLIEACYALNTHVADFFLQKCAVTSRDLDEIELADHGNSNCNGGIIGTYSDVLRKDLENKAGVRYKSQGKTLRTIAKEYSNIINPRDIQFIKTDCEGYDKEIIRSSKEILQEIKPALFVEWFDWFSPEDSADLFAAIEEAGYVPLHPGSLERLTPTGARSSDITCIHRDRISEIIP